MPLIPRVFSFWRNLVHRNRDERDLDDEVRAAFDLLVDEKIRAGMRLQDARRAASLELGGVEGVKEQVRDARSGAFVDFLLQDGTDDRRSSCGCGELVRSVEILLGGYARTTSRVGRRAS